MLKELQQSYEQTNKAHKNIQEQSPTTPQQSKNK
jgi:hypothetical protein